MQTWTAVDIMELGGHVPHMLTCSVHCCIVVVAVTANWREMDDCTEPMYAPMMSKSMSQGPARNHGCGK